MSYVMSGEEEKWTRKDYIQVGVVVLVLVSLIISFIAWMCNSEYQRRHAPTVLAPIVLKDGEGSRMECTDGHGYVYFHGDVKESPTEIVDTIHGGWMTFTDVRTGAQVTTNVPCFAQSRAVPDLRP